MNVDFSLVQKGAQMSKNKVSGKTHSKEQLDNWSKQNNPNNKAYQANNNNRANQLNPKHKTHQQIHNAQRRHPQAESWAPWAPDYIDYDD